MTETRSNSPHYLISRYIQGDLTNEESHELLDLLRNNKNALAVLKANLLIDALLKEETRGTSSEERKTSAKLFAQALANVEQTQNPAASKPVLTPVTSTSNATFTTDTTTEAEVDWDDLVRLQNAEKTISQMKPEEVPVHRTGMIVPVSKLSQSGEKKQERHKWTVRDFFFVGNIVLAILLGIGIYQEEKSEYRRNKPFASVTRAEEFSPVARIVDTIDAEWESGSASYKRGQVLGPGELNLLSGQTRLELVNGTELILEGPTRFLLKKSDSTFCYWGNVSAFVPRKAVGFRIATPFADIIDRGTEFHLDVDRNRAEVNVVRGNVDIHSSELVTKSLETGNACSLDHLGGYKKISYKPERFVSSDRFQFRLAEYVSKKLAEKKKDDLQLNRDPNLIVHLDFSKTNGSRVVNTAAAGRSVCPEANFSGSTSTEGLYSGTKAIRIGNKKDFISFDLEKRWTSLTMFAVVRIDEPLKLGNIFASTIDEARSPGTFLWQISKLGYFQFQIIPDQYGMESCFNSDTFFLPSHQRIWNVFAVVADSSTRSIRFYCDGQRISEVTWNHPIPLETKKVVLGNSLSGKSILSRYLDGAYGDFQLYDRAFSDDEIARRSHLY